MADDTGKRPEEDSNSKEERLVLFGLLALFGVAGLFLLYVSLMGGGIGT